MFSSEGPEHTGCHPQSLAWLKTQGRLEKLLLLLSCRVEKLNKDTCNKCNHQTQAHKNKHNSWN